MVEVAIVCVFVLVGGMHALWGLGIWWPIRDEAKLAKTVVGQLGISRMPRAVLAWAVVGLVALGILWVAMLADWIVVPLPGWFVQLGGVVMAAILLLRGAGSYVFDKKLKQEAQFRHLNLRFYSPLILALGAGVVGLLF